MSETFDASSTSAVILAAGSSTRLGTPKQLLELEGKPVLQHVVDAVSSGGFAEIVVVLGHAAAAIEQALDLPEGARIVVNPDHEEGQSTSLRCGLASIDPESGAAALFVGDQPRIERALVDEVVQTFRSSGAQVARAVYRGTPGHPVVVARAIFEAFGAGTGDSGARSFLEAAEGVVQVDLDADAPRDIDTWEDFEALR